MAFAPADDSRLLVMEANGIVEVWDLDGADTPALFAAIPARAIDAAFSPDGGSVATAGLDGRIRLWGVDGRLKWVSRGGHGGRARSLAVTSAYVASGGEDGAIRLWRFDDGSPMGEPLGGPAAPVVSVAVSARGDLASLGADDAVRLWKLKTDAGGGDPRFESMVLRNADPSRNIESYLRLVRLDIHWGWDHSLAFSPDGALLAAALFDTSVRLWNVDGSPRAVIVDVSHAKRPVRSLAFSPAGDVVSTVSFDGTLRTWTLDGSAARPSFSAHGNAVSSVAFSPRGDRIATAGIDDELRIWKRDGSVVLTFPHAKSSGVDGVAFAPQAPLLAAAAEHGGVRLWNLDGTAGADPLTTGSNRFGAVAFSPAAELVAAAATDTTVGQWNFAGAARGAPLPIGATVAALAFAPSGTSLAVGTAPFQLWRDGRKLWQRPIRVSDYVQAIAFSPRGDFIATGSWLGELQLWNLDGSTRAHRPKTGGIEFITAVAVAPDGQSIVAAMGGVDTVVQVFDLALSPLGEPLGDHQGAVSALTFAPGGELVTGGAEGVVRVWTRPSRQMERFEVGRPIAQLGYWRDLLWVRTADDPAFLQDTNVEGGTILFYDARHTLIATMVLHSNAALVFTPDGWFSATDWPLERLRFFSPSGKPVAPADAARRQSPQRVLAALTGRR